MVAPYNKALVELFYQCLITTGVDKMLKDYSRGRRFLIWGVIAGFALLLSCAVFFGYPYVQSLLQGVIQPVCKTGDISSWVVYNSTTGVEVNSSAANSTQRSINDLLRALRKEDIAKNITWTRLGAYGVEKLNPIEGCRYFAVTSFQEAGGTSLVYTAIGYNTTEDLEEWLQSHKKYGGLVLPRRFLP